MAVDALAGRYELEELIDSGATVAVYSAYDRKLERHVVVKILHEALEADPAAVEHFLREARALGELSHPNLVAVIDSGSAEGSEYVVLEQVEGKRLRDLHPRGHSPGIRAALELAIDVGNGLAFAHAHGVVHRDVKPESVLVAAGGAKLTGFGFARASGLEELTSAELGPGFYISPEQANGHSVDARSDVYSLSVMLYELLTGFLPFSGSSFVEVALAHLSAPLPPLDEHCPDASPRLVAAVSRALEKDPDRRFPSMAAFVAELSACLEEELADAAPVVGGGEQAREAPAAHRSGRRVWIAAVLLVLAALVVLGVILFGSGSKRARAAPPVSVAVALRAAAAYDPPPGNRVEDNGRLRFASDGNPRSFRSTARYRGRYFDHAKSGVGIVFAAARALRLVLRVVSDTPGYRARIEAGTRAAGPFRVVSAEKMAGRDTNFRLRLASAARYDVIWITALSTRTAPDYVAHVNKVSAR